MFILLSLFFSVLFLFLLSFKRLLHSILLLELLSFMTLSLFSQLSSGLCACDHLVVILFSLFVIEGVLALSGLILLVSFSGTDFVSSSSLLKC